MFLLIEEKKRKMCKKKHFPYERKMLADYASLNKILPKICFTFSVKLLFNFYKNWKMRKGKKVYSDYKPGPHGKNIPRV